jgi:hypothetical protein
MKKKFFYKIYFYLFILAVIYLFNNSIINNSAYWLEGYSNVELHLALAIKGSRYNEIKKILQQTEKNYIRLILNEKILIWVGLHFWNMPFWEKIIK